MTLAQQERVEEALGHAVPVKELVACITRWNGKPTWALQAILNGLDGSDDPESLEAQASIEVALAARSTDDRIAA